MRTLLRELVQNADDAEAGRLKFAVVDQGLCNAHNTLLRGPALIVANDGPFLDLNWNALHQALGDSKSADAGKIGRFGVGLKSVFHICEAFVYLGAERGRDTLRSGALNPWAGTGNDSDTDPLHPDWDTLGNGDSQYLLDAARGIARLLRCRTATVDPSETAGASRPGRGGATIRGGSESRQFRNDRSLV